MADGPKTRYGIPVGPDGYVPEAELIKHFNTVYIHMATVHTLCIGQSEFRAIIRCICFRDS